MVKGGRRSFSRSLVALDETEAMIDLNDNTERPQDRSDYDRSATLTADDCRLDLLKGRS